MPKKTIFNIRDKRIDRIKGKTALITGGNSGIGFATAELLKKQGLNVVITGRDQTTIKEAEEKIGCMGYKADSRSKIDLERVFRDASILYGSIDILVYSSGYINPGLISEYSLEEWKKHIDTNLTGAFLCAQLFAKQNISSGHFITISSSSGFEGRKNWGAYCASKAGLISLVETIAKEWEDRFQVFDVAPSRVATKMRRFLVPNENQDDMNQPIDIAKLVCFLLSEENNFPTGTSLWIKNGLVEEWKNSLDGNTGAK